MASRNMKVFSVPTKRNPFILKSMRNNKIPNTIVTLFLGLQLIYGFNFGFIDILNKKLRSLCQCVSYVMTFFVATFIVLPFWYGFADDISFFYNILAAIHYVGVMISLHVSKYKVYNFIKDVRILEDECSNEKRLGWAASLCVFMIFVCKIVAHFYACMLFRNFCANGNVPVYMLYVASSICLEIIYIVQVVLYCYVYNTVNYLKRLVDDSRLDLRAIRKQFSLLADCCDKLTTVYGNLVSPTAESSSS